MYKLCSFKGLLGPIFFCTISTLTPLAVAQFMLLPVAELQLGNNKVQAEIAATISSRVTGLMHRTNLLPNHGMLFVFEELAEHCFWMKNTPLPLSIAFINEHGTILNMADMQPNSLDDHCPTAPIRYALEMKQGWFQQHNVGVGETVKNLPKH